MQFRNKLEGNKIPTRIQTFGPVRGAVIPTVGPRA